MSDKNELIMKVNTLLAHADECVPTASIQIIDLVCQWQKDRDCEIVEKEQTFSYTAVLDYRKRIIKAIRGESDE